MQNFTQFSEIDLNMWIKLMELDVNEKIDWPRFLMPSMILIIFIIALFGNVLTCVVIYFDKTMHTVTNYYLFNLAVSDLLVTFAILLAVPDIIGSDDYPFLNYTLGENACKIHYVLIICLWNNGIMIMTALAVERYVAICHPLILKSSSRRVTKVIMAIWVIAIAEAVPELWTVRLVQTRNFSMCITVPTLMAKIVNAVLVVLSFMIPLGIMTITYLMIAFRMHMMRKKNLKRRIFNHRNNTSKVNKLTITLTLSFVVCWIPFASVRVFIVAVDMKTLMEIDKWWTLWYQISAFNNMLSAILNPLLFSLISTKFRQSLKTLWSRRRQRRARNTVLFRSAPAARAI